MDCRTTFTSSLRKRRAAFTLVEVMVATFLGSIIAAGIATLAIYSGRSFAAMANYVSLDRSSRNALDTMSKDIRQTRRLIASTTTSLSFEDADGTTLSFDYNPSTKKLTRTKAGVTDPVPLLAQCDFLQFSIFQRNPLGGTYGVYPTASAATCKLVQLRWICSREIFGAKVNTESVQSAKIVIRKQ